jgi:serine/threonine-protein kinase
VIEIGQTVGNYIVQAQLGEGGMGAVYLAEHPVIGRKVALKVIHPQYARSHDIVSRFITEAKSVNQIGHDHIVDITDFGTTAGGDFYFVMELLEGTALSELIQQGPRFSPDRALWICAQIADALQASHDHGVIHRDLKPENIFLVAHGGDQDFVKVLDFGLAKLINPSPAATPTHSTKAGLVMGTPCYMAPEQCEGTVEIDHRADIYALGVILFEMLTGEVPFGGTSYATIMLNQVNMAPPAVRELVPDLPPALDAIVSRALAKNPALRFQSMAEMRAALLELIPGVDEIASTRGMNESRGSRTRGRWAILVAAAAAGFFALTMSPYRRPVASIGMAAPTLRRPATVGLPAVSQPDLRAKGVSLVPELAPPALPLLPAGTLSQAPAPRAAPIPSSVPTASGAAARPSTPRAHKAHQTSKRVAASIEEDEILPLSIRD